jgi:hypothetical protein
MRAPPRGRKKSSSHANHFINEFIEEKIVRGLGHVSWVQAMDCSVEENHRGLCARDHSKRIERARGVER